MTDTHPFTIAYHPGLQGKIKNVESLAPGMGCNFLKCLVAHNGDWIAKSWHRREPQAENGYMVLTF